MTNSENVEQDLTHVQNWCEPNEKFFERVDALGGWPIGLKFASFYHSIKSSGRPVEFGNTELRDGWWTTFATADDYYFWKLSDEFKDKFRKEVEVAFAERIVRIAR